MEKVSVVLPCYNHGKYVADAIKSVLNQTYEEIELFVFDNGSTDNSWEEIQKFDDPRMRKIRLEKNNLLMVKQQFIEMASGNYFAIMHSDDVWKEQKLEKQMELIKKNPNARVCFTWSSFVDENLDEIGGLEDFFQEYNKSEQEWWDAFMSRANHLSCPSFLCERDIYIRHFGRLYPYRQVADYYCWMKILEETNLYIVEEVLLNQRIHNSGKNKNESARTAENINREKTELKYIVYKVIDEMQDDVFLKYFCDEKKENTDYSHLDILCEKFLFFVHRNRGFFDERENAIRYYNTYFDYKEGEDIFYQYLEKKFGFSRQDFFDYTGCENDSMAIIESRNRRWELLENVDFSTITYPQSVTIYGCGQIGKVFYKKMKSYCHVEQFIDARPTNDFFDNVPIVTLDKAVLKESDVIVIIPSYDYKQIVENIRKEHSYLTEKNLVTFEDFIKTGRLYEAEI